MLGGGGRGINGNVVVVGVLLIVAHHVATAACICIEALCSDPLLLGSQLLKLIWVVLRQRVYELYLFISQVLTCLELPNLALELPGQITLLLLSFVLEDGLHLSFELLSPFLFEDSGQVPHSFLERCL